jgi:hypothetical protein
MARYSLPVIESIALLRILTSSGHTLGTVNVFSLKTSKSERVLSLTDSKYLAAGADTPPWICGNILLYFIYTHIP